jgi:dGTPase
VLRELMGAYLADDDALPANWRERLTGRDARARARVIADFVAGMTDRYAMGEHRRLFDATPDLR